MEKEVFIKENVTLESEKRLNMAYLLLKNPQMFDIIQKSGGHFLHGTNANALSSILKYGLNSVNSSKENNIEVTTGEEWSRINEKRGFVSLTDSLKIALWYARMQPNNNNLEKNLSNFGVIIGTSLEDMNGINGLPIYSDMPEVGIIGNLPLDHIKFLAVPENKVEFVKKMVGEKNIEVVSMNMRDNFITQNFKEKLNILENGEKNQNEPETKFTKKEVKGVITTRRISMVKKAFENLKYRLKSTKEMDKSERS